MIQQYITMAIFAAPWRRVPPSGVQAAVRLLAVLWRSNQDAALIPHTEFYNDAVNSRDCPVTVKEDHARWRAVSWRLFDLCLTARVTTQAPTHTQPPPVAALTNSRRAMLHVCPRTLLLPDLLKRIVHAAAPAMILLHHTDAPLLPTS